MINHGHLPRLTDLHLSLEQLEDARDISRILLSASNLSHLTVAQAGSCNLDPAEPALNRILASQPALRRLRLGGKYRLAPFLQANSKRDFPSPPSLAAYADLIHSRDLDPSVLDRPHLTPFNPKAQLDYTENEAAYLRQTLRRTLDFGQLELDRMAAEPDGGVAKAVGWVAKLKALEDERLAWKD
ncbi:hypothetical protein RQP46_010494 [Phenoliferia psychrophenolica]